MKYAEDTFKKRMILPRVSDIQLHFSRCLWIKKMYIREYTRSSYSSLNKRKIREKMAVALASLRNVDTNALIKILRA